MHVGKRPGKATIAASACLALFIVPLNAAPASADIAEFDAGEIWADETPQTVEIPDTNNSGPACSDDGVTRVCVELGVASSDAIEWGDEEVTSLDIVPLPAYCVSAGATNGYLGLRDEVCGIFSGNLEVVQRVNGGEVVTGRMSFHYSNYVYMDTSLNRWANQMQVSPYLITGTAAGTQIWGTSTCSGAPCVAMSQKFPVQAPGQHAKANGESYWQWTGTSGQVGAGTPAWQLFFKAPSAANPATLTRTAPTVRCDNAVPGRPVAGCVIPAITPRLNYNGNSFIEFGRHLSGAQASGLGGSVGSGRALHRLTDPTLVSRNRNAACPSSLPRPIGKSCDEYPFASTYEGAALSGGGPRTLSWCQVNLSGPPSTGPAGYSVCMIDERENSSAGSALNSVLYSPMRVLDGDAFHVDIVY